MHTTRKKITPKFINTVLINIDKNIFIVNNYYTNLIFIILSGVEFTNIDEYTPEDITKIKLLNKHLITPVNEDLDVASFIRQWAKAIYREHKIQYSLWRKQEFNSMLNMSDQELFNYTIKSQIPDYHDGNFTIYGKFKRLMSIRLFSKRLKSFTGVYDFSGEQDPHPNHANMTDNERVRERLRNLLSPIVTQFFFFEHKDKNDKIKKLVDDNFLIAKSALNSIKKILKQD